MAHPIQSLPSSSGLHPLFLKREETLAEGGLKKLFSFPAEGDPASQPRRHSGSAAAQDRGGDEGEHVHRHPEAAQGDRAAKADRPQPGEDHQPAGLGQGRPEPATRTGTRLFEHCFLIAALPEKSIWLYFVP